MITIVLGFLAGAALWTFGEYTIHRFAFHEARGRNYGSREHLRHHARREFSLRDNWPAWLGVVGVGYGLARLTGWPSVGVGWVLAYAHYEWLHMACHLWAPRTRYGAFVRRHHFHHHFGAPLRNHGVTSPVWDLVFGTYDRVDRVVVPRRLAFRWLLDPATGEVKPEHRGDYAVRGSAPLVEDEELQRAFANEAPLVV